MDRIRNLFRPPVPKLDVDTELTQKTTFTHDHSVCLNSEIECRVLTDKPREDEARRRLEFIREDLRTMRGSNEPDRYL